MITEPELEILYCTNYNTFFTPEQCQMIIDAGRAEPKTMQKLEDFKGIKGGK